MHWIRFLILAGAGLEMAGGLPRLGGSEASPASPAWESLFDGQTFHGWRGFKKPGFPEKGWVVENGCLKHLKAGGGGDIITTRQFTDFDLEWEWKVGPNANSGVKYCLTEERSGPIGHEYQILDDAASLAKTAAGKGATGALYDLIPPLNPPVRPAGEWNQSRILVQGVHVEHWLNGIKVVEYTLESPELLKAVAASKFKGVSGFGTRRPGPILLQDHGGEVWFRGLRLRPLTSP